MVRRDTSHSNSKTIHLTSREAVDAYNELRDDKENLSQLISDFVVDCRRRKQQTKLLVANNGVTQNEAFIGEISKEQEQVLEQQQRQKELEEIEAMEVRRQKEREIDQAHINSHHFAILDMKSKNDTKTLKTYLTMKTEADVPCKGCAVELCTLTEEQEPKTEQKQEIDKHIASG